MKVIFPVLLFTLHITSSWFPRGYCSETSAPMYQRSRGIKFGAGGSDRATAIAVFYSIPVIHEILLNPMKESNDPDNQIEKLANFLSDNIKTLDRSEVLIDFSQQPIENPRDGVLSSVLEYVGVCIKMLGNREMKPFKFLGHVCVIDLAQKIRRDYDAEKRFWKTFRVGDGYLNISSAINDKFINETITRKLRDFDPNLKYAFFYKSVPEVLMFFISRNESKVDALMMLEKSLKVGKFDFELCTRIIYNSELSTIEVISHDFGNGKDYLYRNSGEVVELEPIAEDVNSFPDYNSQMVFYVKKSTVESIKNKKLNARLAEKLVPSEVENTQIEYDTNEHKNMTKRKIDDQDSESTVSPTSDSHSSKKSKKDEITQLKLEDLNKSSSTLEFESTLPAELVEKLKQIYWINAEDVYEAFRNLVLRNHELLLSKLADWPVERLDVVSKLNSPNFYLGVSNYSFKPSPEGTHYVALEITLNALASSFKNSLKLFNYVSETESNPAKKELGLVILRMNLGMKNISLDRLVSEFKALGCVFDNHQNSDLLDQIRTIMGFLKKQISRSRALIEASLGKAIEYQGLDSDDPVNVFRARERIVDIKNCIEPPVTPIIDGVWADYTNEEKKNRFRNIYRSDAETFCVLINRRLEKGQNVFSDAEFERVENGYVVVGAVFVNSNDEVVKAVFINDFANRSYRLYRSGEGIKIQNGLLEDFVEYIDKHAIIIFYSKEGSRDSISMKSSALSKYVKNLLEDEYNNESKVEMVVDVEMIVPVNLITESETNDPINPISESETTEPFNPISESEKIEPINTMSECLESAQARNYDI